MFNRILVAIDPSHDIRQDRTMSVARKLAYDALSEITALTVIAPSSPLVPGEAAPDARARAAQTAMQALRERVGEDSEIATVIRHGTPDAEIVEYARDHDIDCILIASHRPGLKDYFLGSTATRVVRHAPCTVIVLR